MQRITGTLFVFPQLTNHLTLSSLTLEEELPAYLGWKTTCPGLSGLGVQNWSARLVMASFILIPPKSMSTVFLHSLM